MADEQNAGMNEASTNGEGRSAATGEAPTNAEESRGTAEQHRQLQELTNAYNRARDELNEAIRNVRSELARVDIDQARRRAKSWVDENPTLAVFLGIGAGIFAGRLLSSAMHPEPPPLPERARHRAQMMVRDGGEYAGELGAVIAKQVARAVHEAGEAGAFAAKRSGEVAETVGRKARTLGDDVSHRAEKASRNLSKQAERVGRDASHRARDLGESLSSRVDEIADALSDGASRSFHELEDVAHDLSKTVKKKSKRAKKKTQKKVNRGIDYSDAMLNAARTAVAAVVLKRVNSWMKSMR